MPFFELLCNSAWRLVLFMGGTHAATETIVFITFAFFWAHHSENHPVLFVFEFWLNASSYHFIFLQAQITLLYILTRPKLQNIM
jgi:hypothetical protein